MSSVHESFRMFQEEIRKIFFGSDDLITCLYLCFLNAAVGENAHLLLTGEPGTGKTLLSRTLATVFGLEGGRLQGHPDLVPHDIVGSMDIMTREFVEGPVFVNVFHIDEISRVFGKSRSALLESMEEWSVTDAETKTTYPLPRPFVVVATQNPDAFEDADPLEPQEADRFPLSFFAPTPDRGVRREVIISKKILPENRPVPQQVLGWGAFAQMARGIGDVHISRGVEDYVLALTEQLIAPQSSGLSEANKSAIKKMPPNRASISFLNFGRALAYLRGKAYVSDEHINWLAPFVLPHRIETVGIRDLKHKQIKSIVEEAIRGAREEMARA